MFLKYSCQWVEMVAERADGSPASRRPRAQQLGMAWEGQADESSCPPPAHPAQGQLEIALCKASAHAACPIQSLSLNSFSCLKHPASHHKATSRINQDCEGQVEIQTSRTALENWNLYAVWVSWKYELKVPVMKHLDDYYGYSKYHQESRTLYILYGSGVCAISSKGI